jgi:hypothetical protein
MLREDSVVHHQHTIVTLRELPSKRPLREFQHSRSGNTSSVVIRLPFGTEYGIALKTQDAGRRRMEVTIDGTLAADLIFSGGYGIEEILERFQHSDKKFKFVKANSAAVADPSNPSNGGITVKVWREYRYQFSQVVHVGPIPNWNTGVLRGNMSPEVFGGRTADTYCCASSHPESAPCCMVSPASHLTSDRGATVEGSSSEQTFASTHWNGDEGEPLVFFFQLLGPSAEVGSAKFCPRCGASAGPSSNFCRNCGKDLRF